MYGSKHRKRGDVEVTPLLHRAASRARRPMGAGWGGLQREKYHRQQHRLVWGQSSIASGGQCVGSSRNPSTENPNPCPAGNERGDGSKGGRGTRVVEGWGGVWETVTPCKPPPELADTRRNELLSESRAECDPIASRSNSSRLSDEEFRNVQEPSSKYSMSTAIHSPVH